MRRTVAFLPFLFLLAHLATGVLFVADRSPDTNAAWTGYPLDDAWIHMVYSRSLAREGLPCYNDGEPENGYTSPLWMAIGAVPHLLEEWFNLSAVISVKAIGVLVGWLASCVLALLLFGVGCRLAAAAFGGFALALSPLLTFAEVSGMEVMLAAFLGLAALVAYRARAFLSAGIFAGLALLARPEMSILPAGLLLLFVWERLFTGKGGGAEPGESEKPHASGFQAFVKLLLPPLACAGLWVIASIVVTGRPLPNTFYAKYHDAGLHDSTLFYSVVEESVKRPPIIIVILLAHLFILGTVRLFGIRRKLLALFTVAFCPVFVYAVCATREMPPGCTQYFYWWRYLVPALPFLWFFAALGVDGFFGVGEKGSSSLSKFMGIVMAGTLLFCLGARLPAGAGTYAWNCQNINEVQVELGRWVNGNVPAGGTVAVNDAGAIRYFGERKTLDLGGLNRHVGLGEMEKGADFTRLRLPAKKKWLETHDVDFLIIFPAWFIDVAVSRAFPVMEERRSTNYTICKPPPPGKIGQDVMRVYKTR